MNKTVAEPPEEQIISLVSFFEYLQNRPDSARRRDLYRGHGDHKYKLDPSLFRKSYLRKHEKNVGRELISLHPSEFVNDRNVFEQLVRMQHHSLPTRLLDLTYNPLVALYFACKDKPRSDGAFITLSVYRSRIRYFDSDTVSCVAGLSNLTSTERNKLRNIETVQELVESHEGKRLLQFIRMEKPYFLPEIEPTDLLSVQVVRPKQNNRRIIAQQGAFLLFGLLDELEDDNAFDIRVTRAHVPSGSKTQILRELDQININESSLFPEIEYTARYLMQQLTPVEES